MKRSLRSLPLGLAHRLRNSVVHYPDNRIHRCVSRLARRDVRRIQTYTKPVELAALYRLARACPPGAATLEIGSHLGASACYLAAGLAERSGVLYCVDTWNNETMPEGIRDTWTEFQGNVDAFKDSIRLVRKRSEDLLDSDLPPALHLAFIDGDHGYEAAKSDFEHLSKAVVPGGVIAFHDSIGHDFPGPSRVLGEALASGQWQLRGLVYTLSWVERKL